MFKGRAVPIDRPAIDILLARFEYLSTELARSRSAERINLLSAMLEGNRWELLFKHAVEVKPWQGKPQPLAPASA